MLASRHAGIGFAVFAMGAYHRTDMRTTPRPTSRDVTRIEWAIVRQLELAMRRRNLNNVQVARELGMGESSIRALLTGVNRASLDTIARLVAWDPNRFRPMVMPYIELLGNSLIPERSEGIASAEEAV